MVEASDSFKKQEDEKATGLMDAPMSMHYDDKNQRINTLLLNNAVFQACKLQTFENTSSLGNLLLFQLNSTGEDCQSLARVT